MNKIKILVIPKDRETKTIQRIVETHLTLDSEYDDFFVDINMDIETISDDQLKEYDIVVFNEYINEIHSFLDKLDEFGITSVLDIDEDWRIDKNHQYYRWVKHKEAEIKSIIKRTKHITTTNEILGNIIKKISPKSNITIIPEGIKLKKYETSKSDKLRIGIIAEDYDLEQFEILNGIVDKLKNKGILNKIQFVLCGFNLESFKYQKNEITGQNEKVKNDIKDCPWVMMENILTNNLEILSNEFKTKLLKYNEEISTSEFEHEPYKRLWSVNYKKRGLYYKNIDILLNPLKPNRYIETTSPTKLIEANYFGKPMITNNIGLYGKKIQNAYMRGGKIDYNNGNGFLIETRKNHKDWVKYLSKCVEDKENINKLMNNVSDNQNTYENVINIMSNFYKKLR